MKPKPGQTRLPAEEARDLLRRMEARIEHWREEGDRRHVFLSCYRLMTGNMLRAIEAGEFRDRVWVRRLLHHFADYYFDALSCYDCGDEVPPVWQHVHQLSTTRPLHRLQCLLLGINAHINYDLVLTLYDMLAPEWEGLATSARRSRFEDHSRVNHIIGRTIDRVQDDILEPGDRLMAIVDRAFGRLDEYLLSRLIRHWRQEVWEEAQRMLLAPNAAAREKLRQEREFTVMRTARLLT